MGSTFHSADSQSDSLHNQCRYSCSQKETSPSDKKYRWSSFLRKFDSRHCRAYTCRSRRPIHHHIVHTSGLFRKAPTNESSSSRRSRKSRSSSWPNTFCRDRHSRRTSLFRKRRRSDSHPKAPIQWRKKCRLIPWCRSDSCCCTEKERHQRLDTHEFLRGLDSLLRSHSAICLFGMTCTPRPWSK